jgi:transposase-like protein
MAHQVESLDQSRSRVYRTIAEKRRFVELTLGDDKSVAQVAREVGINANQLFRWRREYQAGLLMEESNTICHLLPVHVATENLSEDEAGPWEADAEPAADESEPISRGSIHIDIEAGRTAITAEHGADPELLRAALEVLRR